ncbi:MAG: IS701 family transposase [Nitrospinota bacterium]|nr:IS701 family transposase [Nitrospinota bacterium]
MLPECRQQDYLFCVPKFEVTSNDVESFMDQLRCFHDEFRDCFQRSETRENVFRYMGGQFSKLERKSIEPIALAVEEGQVRSMQRAISDAVWEEDKMLSKYHRMVNDDMGDPNGVLIFDESGFIKKGEDSAGVRRQYCGSIGKVDNCQVGVYAAYASVHGYALLDKRLFVPEEWFSEEYKHRRKKCNFPEKLSFQTKPQLASEMLSEIHREQILPYKYIVADSIYGHSPAFIEEVEKLEDKIYMVSISADTQCWLKTPATRKKKYKYKGEERSKTVLENSAKNPVTVHQVASSLNDYFWYRRKVSEGTKGPIEYEFSKRRVTLSKDGLPWKTIWLIIRRTIEKTPRYTFFIRNAPENTQLSTFVWLSGIRWAIEQCFEEGKTELGMDHYEVRKYPGWNHHMMVIMLAHFFLWHLKIKLGKKSSSYYSLAA